MNESFSRLEFMLEGKSLQGRDVPRAGYARRYNNSHFRLSSSNPNNQSNTESLEHDMKKRRRRDTDECSIIEWMTSNAT